MPYRVAVLSLLLSFAALLSAQQPDSSPRYQLCAGYSLLSNSLDGLPGAHHVLNGWEASVAFPPWHALRFRIDTTAYRGTNQGAPQHPYFILGGGQYAWKLRRESIYALGLTGTAGANRNWPANGANGQTASFAALVGGGIDTPLTRRFAFRVEGGYQYSYFVYNGLLNNPYGVPGLPTNFGRLSTGLVWNF